jgi:hypothetical protein
MGLGVDVHVERALDSATPTIAVSTKASGSAARNGRPSRLTRTTVM